MSSIEVFHDDRLEVRRAVTLLRASPRLLAGAFTDRAGVVDWAAVELACATCLDLGLAPLENVAKCPVINNRVYLMAEVCRVLAARAGWNIDILEDDDSHCTGVIWRGDRKPPPLTITMTEARRMGSAGRASTLVSGAEIGELRSMERTLKLKIARKQINPSGRIAARAISNTLPTRTLSPLPGEIFS